jgi:ferredoxin-NADP reductase
MPTPSCLTTCSHNRPIAANAREIRLRMPAGEKLTFRAGQFVLWDIPDVDKPEAIEPRAYSIASPPSEDSELTFVLDAKEGGRATRYVWEMLKEGDPVRIQGPFGGMQLDTATRKNYVFIATGSGLAPFLSMIRSALEQEGEIRPMDLFFCVRYREHLFWEEKLLALARRHPNFHPHISLTRPSGDWSGLCGRVMETIPAIIDDYTNISAYVCGKPEMVKDVRQWLLGQGIPSDDLHSEGYV